MRKWWIVGAAALLVAAAAVFGVLVMRGDGPPAAQQPAVQQDAVLLIPGYGGATTALEPLQAALWDAGFEVEVVDIGDGTGDLNGYAQDVVNRAQELRSDGAPTVSTVGYSAGGVIGRIAATASPETFEHVVSLASPHAGTLWASLAGNCPTACQQLRPGSDLLRSLPAAPDPADWLAVYSTSDEVIVPADSSALPGATVITVQSLTPGATLRHGQVPGDPAVIDTVSGFLQR